MDDAAYYITLKQARLGEQNLLAAVSEAERAKNKEHIFLSARLPHCSPIYLSRRPQAENSISSSEFAWHCTLAEPALSNYSVL